MVGILLNSRSPKGKKRTPTTYAWNWGLSSGTDDESSSEATSWPSHVDGAYSARSVEFSKIPESGLQPVRVLTAHQQSSGVAYLRNRFPIRKLLRSPENPGDTLTD